eukprot:8687097-Lingulodinium_polyedra.AAC.1
METYKEWHGIEPGAEVDASIKALLDGYKQLGNLTKPCAQPLPDEAVLAMGTAGVRAALLWL